VEELQADEIRTIVGGKQQPIWIFASIDVWSRLWPSTVVGRRSYRNTYSVSRWSQAHGSCTLPNDRHGRIRVLRKSRTAGLWASVSLRPGDQNAQERIVWSAWSEEPGSVPLGGGSRRWVTQRTLRN
jgi:hypothetical protein